jgi:cell division protein FtsL
MKRTRKKAAMAEFHTVKRIDNSRLVRNVEPAKMRNLWRTLGLGGVVAAFFMLYIFQHFRCIDLSFQLEDLKAQEMKAAALNSELKLEIAGLRNPMRIDVIARRRLGLTQPLPTQVQEYEAPDGAEVAARYVRPNRTP